MNFAQRCTAATAAMIPFILVALTARAGRAGESPFHDAGGHQVSDTLVVALVNGLWYADGAFASHEFHMVDGRLAEPGGLVADSVIDLAGWYVIPPFGDAHTHNLDGPFDLERVVDDYLREGTFYVSVLTNSASGAAAVRAGFEGPCTLDVTYANGGVTSTLSHPFLAYEPRAMGLYADWEDHAEAIRASRIREGDAYWFVDERQDLDRQWSSILDGAPDLLKIFLLDAREDPPPPGEAGLPHGHGLRPSVARYVVQRANEADLRVAAHVETAADFSLAVEAGVDIIAHLPGYSYGLDPTGALEPEAPTAPYLLDGAVALPARTRGVVVTPTISWAYAAAGADSASVISRRLAVMRDNVSVLQENGVGLVVGSDWFGETAWHEITAMRALGSWTDGQLLDMWARDTPQAIFPDRGLGVLQAGREASFLALTENPLEDLEAVRSISLRVKQGCVLAGM